MNSNYGPQNGHYGYANHNYAPVAQPQYAPMPVAQNAGSGMKMVAGAVALLAIGIGAFAVVFGMKNDASPATTAAQAPSSTVVNLPSEINIPSLGTPSPAAPVVVNNPAPRVITVPGQAPGQKQAPAQNPPPVPNQNPAPVQNQNPVPVQNQGPVQNNGGTNGPATNDQGTKDQGTTEKQNKNAQDAKALRDQAEAFKQQAAASRSQAVPGNPVAPALEQQATQFDLAAKQASDAADQIEAGN